MDDNHCSEERVEIGDILYFTIYDGQLVIFSILIFMVCDTVIEL